MTPRIAEGAVPKLPISSVFGRTRSKPYVPAKVAESADTPFSKYLSTIAHKYLERNGKYIAASTVKINLLPNSSALV